MDNSTGQAFFVLQGLTDTKTTKQIYFVCSFLAYTLSVFVNLTLIVTILREKLLHEPMHMFVCNLCFNAIYGASGFYPVFLSSLLSDSQRISYSVCLVQIYVIYSYIFCEFISLAAMAYDRYVAICKPLEYHSIMTHKNVGKLLLITWLIPFVESVIGIILTARLPLCGFRINKLYCTNWEVVKLSCIDTTINNLYGYTLTIFQVFLVCLLIIISYIYIVRASLRSRGGKAKFMETCMPHLVTLVNFTLAIIFDVMYARYGSSTNLQALRNIIALEYIVVPPLLNPLIYGIKLTQIRTMVWRLFRKIIYKSK